MNGDCTCSISEIQSRNKKLSTFIGKPADFRAVNDVDWVPSIGIDVTESVQSDTHRIVVDQHVRYVQFID